MKSMNLRRWADRGVSCGILTAVVLAYSMVSLAASSKPIGELSFSESSEKAVVSVNGEAAKSGRTLFGDSTISTSAEAQAVISIGGGAKLQLASSTTFALSSDQRSSAGNLMSGNITMLSGSEPVSIRNLAGELVKLNPGDSVEAGASTAVKQSGRIGGLEPWQLALIIGAAVAVIVIVVATRGDDSSPTSPIR